MKHNQNDHSHCEGCGITIPLCGEFASIEEMLCDTCLQRHENRTNEQEAALEFTD